jgi:16S rRNA processing protein RimM
MPLADVRLTVGRIGGTHGVHGEMRMRLLTDDPDNLQTVTTVYLGERDTPIALEGIRFTNDGALIKLQGTDTPEDAAKLSGLAVKISGTDVRPLEEGEYFLFQLIGLKAESEDGDPIGVVVDLIETGAHDVLVIGERPDTAEQLLVPNHPEFVLEMTPEEQRIVIRPPAYE